MEEKNRPQPRVSTTNLGVGLPSSTYSAAGGTPSWRSGPSPSPTPPMTGMTPTTPLPPPTNVAPRALTERESQLVKHLSRLQFFLATAPTRWMGADDGAIRADVHTSPLQSGSLSSPHPNLNRFLLPNGEHVACVFWNGLYHITGTDIVRALVFRFEAFSRPVKNIKKFEEGVFSDLRNLKPGTDACLEEPKSPFLDLLFRNGCIRTQKKVSNVFYWFSVPHDRLFLDALERDLKREKMGLEATTVVVGEPARSFRYDPKRSLFEQFAGKQPGIEESINNARLSDNSVSQNLAATHSLPQSPKFSLREPQKDQQVEASSSHHDQEPSLTRQADVEASIRSADPHQQKDGLSCPATANTVLFSRSLLKGSPAYKQGRRKSSREKKQRHTRDGTANTEYDTGEDESGSDSDRLQQTDYTFSNFQGDSRQQHSPFVPPPLPIYGDSKTSSLAFTAPGPIQAVGLAHMAGAPSAFTSAQSYSQSSGEIAWNSALASITPDDKMTNLPAYSPMNVITRTPQPTISTQIPGGSSAAPAKGFSCPLLSCGRLFKRLEHLKRHVRTHTHERPYECTRCAKRFSRSDNLTQHIKTHEKADRGERMKTEASESTEDDMATLLEAEVDAMAAREDRGFSASGDVPNGVDEHFSFTYGDHTSSIQSQWTGGELPANEGLQLTDIN
ncbi:hypothetical protein I317_04337 [Kwoniella heveanensis CBS 569]|nr:hypothetical protein I317_04337 [Kwoniella heveanensis CBS 569]